MRRTAALLCSLALSAPASAGSDYVLRDVCPGYQLGRDRKDIQVVTVTCPNGRVQYKFVWLCNGGAVTVYYKGGNAWIVCKGQPRPKASM